MTAAALATRPTETPTETPDATTQTVPQATSQATSQSQAPLDFAQFYVEGYPRTVAHLRRRMAQGSRNTQNPDRCGDGKQADDLAQDVWLDVWRHWPTLRHLPLSAVWAFTQRATTNALTDLYRRRQVATKHGQRRFTEETWEIAQHTLTDRARGDQPEAAALDSETMAELRALVARISATRPTRRGAARLDLTLLEAMLDGEPQTVTAERLGLTIGVVKMRGWRLRQQLRRRLSGDLNDDVTDDDDDEADEGEEAQAV